MIFHGWVRDGRLRLDDSDRMKSFIASMEGKPFVVDLQVGKTKRSRSLNQNAWYWSTIVPLLAEHCGYDSDEIHEALKHEFLRDRENEKDGLVKVRSTSSLDTAQFSDYCEKCRRLAAEMGVVIPDPGMAF